MQRNVYIQNPLIENGVVYLYATYFKVRVSHVLCPKLHLKHFKFKNNFSSLLSSTSALDFCSLYIKYRPPLTEQCDNHVTYDYVTTLPAHKNTHQLLSLTYEHIHSNDTPVVSLYQRLLSRANHSNCVRLLHVVRSMFVPNSA